MSGIYYENTYYFYYQVFIISWISLPDNAIPWNAGLHSIYSLWECIIIELAILFIFQITVEIKEATILNK